MITHSTLGALVALLALALPASAGVKVSVEDGPWERIRWLPGGGPPDPGDTVIVSSHVTGMPAGRFGHLVVNNVGTLEIGPGERTLAGLRCDGRIVIDTTVRLRVDGSLDVAGRIVGGRAIVMTRAGASIRAIRPLGTLVIEARGSIVALAPLSLTSLVVDDGGRLDLGDHDLLIRGSYSGARTTPGIAAGAGLVTVLGHCRGAIDASVTLGGAGALGLGHDVAEVSAVIGGEGRTVRIAGARRARFATLVGEVIVEATAELESDGIGLRATNDIVGALVVRGRISGVEPEYAWRVDGDVTVTGSIGGCVVQVRGVERRLSSEGARWDGSVRLVYRERANAVLTLDGAVDLSELEIAGLGEADTGVVVRSARGEVRVRHRFASDAERACRLESDHPVRLYDQIAGVVEAPVVVEGFWGSSIGGRLGRAGDTVWLTMPKRVAEPLAIVGTLEQRPRGRLAIASSLELPTGVTLAAPTALDSAGLLLPLGDIAFERDVHGCGTIVLPVGDVTVRGTVGLGDSTTLRIGTDSTATTATVDGLLSVGRVDIGTGSAVVYAPAGRLTPSVARLRTTVIGGFELLSVAAIPPGAAASDAFSSADSEVFGFEGGYVAVDVVEPGRGYWISHTGTTRIEQEGAFVQPEVHVPVRAGWNLIGSPSVRVDAGAIRGVGTTILAGPFDDASTPVTRLEPGRAYWVDVATDGVLTFR